MRVDVCVGCISMVIFLVVLSFRCMQVSRHMFNYTYWSVCICIPIKYKQPDLRLRCVNLHFTSIHLSIFLLLHLWYEYV